MARAHNPYGAGDRAVKAIDRERERERRYMLQACYKHADELSTKLVQKLLDNHIVEATSEQTLREVFTSLLSRLAEIEEFDFQFKIAPLRTLVNDPNFVSLYLTQYIIEDLIEHPCILDVFGDDMDIYKTVDLVMAQIRPKS